MATPPTPKRRSPPSHRKDLGPFFSEGSRQMWLGLERDGLSMSEFQREIGAHAGDVPRAMYGDRKPSHAVMEGAERRWGVTIAMWRQEPLEDFVPPAAREPETSKPSAA